MSPLETASQVEDAPAPAPEPESPFASDGFARSLQATAPSRAFATAYELHTPFLSEYGEDAVGIAGGPRAELFASLMAELHDPEFEDAVTDLVHEVSALASQGFAHEGADATEERAEALGRLREVVAPLERECRAALDRVEEALSEADLGGLTEGEVDELLDRVELPQTSLSPAFEEFLGKFLKKAKKAVGAAVKLAKKGVALATKLSPVHLILGRLKGLVRPLLERVLRSALDRLPVAIRPIAQKLAHRLLGIGKAEATAAPEPAGEDAVGEAASSDPAALTREVDARLASTMLGGEDVERYEDQLEEDEAARHALAWRRLQRARARFARKVTGLPPGANPAPAVEEFVPAILAALKLGVSVIGRPRVVSFLAGLVAKLISKYVGQAQATQLSRALVDVGLRVVGLEAPADAPEVAGEALAATVEDTVNRVVQAAPQAAWESEAMLDGYVREAFARAASAHFPDGVIRPDLHEAAQTSGAWELRPVGAATKLYKKYSRVLEASITPQLAAAVHTFGGVPLSAVLRDQLGVPAGRTVRARVHLYEALAGTRLADVASQEKGVRGLGSARRDAVSLLHPLTPEAAGLLLKEPALGKSVDPRYLAERAVIQVGQRFYHLELGDEEGRVAARLGRPARVGRTKVVLDFPAGFLRVFLYYSEAEAQALAASLRKRAAPSAVLGALRSGHEARIIALLSGAPTRALRIVHPGVPAQTLLPARPAKVLAAVGRELAGAVVKWLLESFGKELERRYDAFTAEIAKAAEARSDGITIVVTFARPPLLDSLRSVLAGDEVALARLRKGAGPSSASEFTISIRPGYVRA